MRIIPGGVRILVWFFVLCAGGRAATVYQVTYNKFVQIDSGIQQRTQGYDGELGRFYLAVRPTHPPEYDFYGSMAYDFKPWNGGWCIGGPVNKCFSSTADLRSWIASDLGEMVDAKNANLSANAGVTWRGYFFLDLPNLTIGADASSLVPGGQFATALVRMFGSSSAVDAPGNLKNLNNCTCPSSLEKAKILNPFVLDPIDLTTGNMHLSSLDVSGAIPFWRHYNSMDGASGGIGAGWRHSYSQALSPIVSTAAEVYLTARGEFGEDTKLYLLNGSWATKGGDNKSLLQRADGTWLLSAPGAYQELYDSSGALIGRYQPGGGHLNLSRSGAVGSLKVVVSNQFGRSIALNKDNRGDVSNVSDQSGNIIVSYGYDRPNLQVNLLNNVGFVNDPSGGAIKYLHENPDYVSVMTGMVDENHAISDNVKFASWAVDGLGRTTGSVNAGGVNGGSIVLGSNSTTFVDQLSAQRIYGFTGLDGRALVTTVSQPAGAGSPAASTIAAYDERGNLSSLDDASGRRACYAYSSASNTSVANLEVVRVEGLTGGASGTACTGGTGVLAPGAVLPKSTDGSQSQVSRKVSTQWHPQWALKTRQAEPKLLTTWVYNGQPDPFNGNQVANCVSNTYTTSTTAPTLPDGSPIAVLCKKVEQATTDVDGSQGFNATLDNEDVSHVWQRVDSYTYTEYGQELTHTGPTGVTTTRGYYTGAAVFSGTAPNEVGHYPGDLKSAGVAGVASLTTTYDNYDRAGRLLQSTDPNGLVTKYSYTPRGWLSTITVGNLLTSYDYWPTGLLKKVSQPDGSALYYQWDDAHRLTDVSDQLSASGAPAGNWVHYTLDNAGNRKGEDIKDSTGALVRNIARNYDALSRLQNVKGAHQ